jgi:pimeloyl-ACP methyl ester carboxylesterase
LGSDILPMGGEAPTDPLRSTGHGPVGLGCERYLFRRHRVRSRNSFALFGISQGTAVAIAYPAKYPSRVSKLVLHGAYALGRTKRNTTEDEEQAAAYLTLIRHGWGYPHSAFMQAFSSLYLPDGTSEQIKWFSELQRVTTSPENAIRIRKACDEIDIVELLAKVRAPTLVTHSRNDNVVPFDHGRKIASAISGARFLGYCPGSPRDRPS